MVFERRLLKGALEYLRTEAARANGSWWRDVLDAKYQSSDGEKRQLLIAVRKNYMNAYADGQSIFEIRIPLRGGAHPRCRIAQPFVLGANKGAGQFIFDGQRAGIMVPYAGARTLQAWIGNALKHPSLQPEKVGVAAIAKRHPNVIDVEVALPGLPGGAPRMDLACLERTDDSVCLVFYEVKQFCNSELRADNLDPEVLAQLRRYEDYVSDEARRNRVVGAYRNACVILRDIAEMRGTAVDPLVHEVAENPAIRLGLDPKPRLVVFGYAAHEIDSNSSWRMNGHEDKLKQALGNRLIMHERAKDVRLGVGP